MVDHLGTRGYNNYLGAGWYYRIDPANSSTNTQRHIHVWNEKNSWAQNEDGSPHDKHNNQSGELPSRVQKLVMHKTGWDYNGNRLKFFSNTKLVTRDDGNSFYSYADSTFVKTEEKLLVVDDSIDRFESRYYQENNSNGVFYNTQIYVFPIPSLPVTLPSLNIGTFFLSPMPFLP